MRLSTHAVCSIAHLPAAERAKIEALIGTAPIRNGRLFVDHPLLMIEPHPYGFAIHLGIFDDHPEQPEAISPELWALLILARLQDAEWLRFDRDEPPTTSLPIFADTGEAKAGSVTIHCDHCGSTKVERDACAHWDIAAQEWVLGAVFDAGYCRSCEADTRLVERRVAAV